MLNLLGCLDRPDCGSYWFDGLELTQLSKTQQAILRSRRIGFVFQNFNLLPRTTALDNVRMPTAYSTEGCSYRERSRRSRGLLDGVGLAARLDHAPAEMSGGEQQRVAIARSLVNRPALLLADEPTGNLDSQTGEEILRLFRQLSAERGITLLLVTHDPDVARHADRVIRMSDGKIVDAPGHEAAPARAISRAIAAEAADTEGLLRERGKHTQWRIVLGAALIALKALRRNVMRTVLTMLGVIIGVAAVISMMEISQGASKAIQVTVAKMGANTLSVFPPPMQAGGSRVSGTADSLTADDADAIERECPTVVCAAPVVYAQTQVVFGNRNWIPNYAIGSTPDFLEVRNWTEMELGRAFTQREVLSGSKVCLIGQTLVHELFGEKYPIGEEIRVQNVPFKIIGVLEGKGANLLGTDQDDILIAPWTTLKARISGRSTSGSNRIGTGRSFPGRSFEQRLPGVSARCATRTSGRFSSRPNRPRPFLRPSPPLPSCSATGIGSSPTRTTSAFATWPKWPAHWRTRSA